MTDVSQARKQSSPSAGSEGFDLAKLLLEGRAFFALIVIIVVFSILSPYYLSVANFLTMASHVAIFGILAVGMLLVILNGGIDLSVGSTLGLAGVVAGFLMQGVTLTWLGVVLYPPVWVVALLACMLGAVVGLINGILIARFKVPAFVATLGVMYMARGLALLMTSGLTYNNLGGKPELGNTGFDALGFNRLFGVPTGVVILVVIALIGSVVLNRTAFGRWLYASGGNERAAELSGVPVKTAGFRLCAVRHLCRHCRPDPVLAADVGGADCRHHLRIDGHRGRRHRRRGADRRARQHPRNPAWRLRHRFPFRWSGDHRHLVLLADCVHRRRHRARRASQCRSVSPP